MSFKVGDKVTYGGCPMTVHFVSGDAITCVRKIKRDGLVTFESIVLNVTLLKKSLTQPD